MNLLRLHIPGFFTLLLGGALHAQSTPARWELSEDFRLAPDRSSPGALTDVTSIAVSPNGTLAVLERSQYQVRLYDRSGKFLRAIGRRGQGPGELEQPDHIGFRGDTLWISDSRLSRVSLFSVDGRLIEALALASLGPSPITGSAQVLTPEGGVILVQPFTIGPPPGTRRTLPLLALSRRERRLDTLRVVETTDGARFIPLARGRIAIIDPYIQDPVVAYSPRGDLVAIVDRRIASEPAGATYGIDVIASTGTAIASRRHPYVPRPVSAVERDSVYRTILDPGHVPEFFPTEAAALRAIGEGVPTPRYWPPVREVRVGSDSTIWLRRGHDEWLVADAWASAIATVTVPAGVRLMAVQRSHAWGVSLDSDDLPTLVRYRVIPR